MGGDPESHISGNMLFDRAETRTLKIGEFLLSPILENAREIVLFYSFIYIT